MEAVSTWSWILSQQLFGLSSGASGRCVVTWLPGASLMNILFCSRPDETNFSFSSCTTPFSDLPLSSGFWSRQNTPLFFSHLHSRDYWHQPDPKRCTNLSQPRFSALALLPSPLPAGISHMCKNDTLTLFLFYGEVYLAKVPYMSDNDTYLVQTIQRSPWAVLSQTLNVREKVRTTKEGEREGMLIKKVRSKIKFS